MTEQEEQKIREIIDSLLPMKDLDEYLENLEKKDKVYNATLPLANKVSGGEGVMKGD